MPGVLQVGTLRPPPAAANARRVRVPHAHVTAGRAGFAPSAPLRRAAARADLARALAGA